MHGSLAQSIMYGTLAAIDGWLCCITQPSVQNSADYHSKHYECYGLNVQAVCDSNLQFIYFLVAGPEKTNDGRVINCCSSFLDWFESLPAKFYVVGDNA